MEGRLLQKALAAGTAEIVRRARSNIRGNVPDDFVGPPVPYPRGRTGTLRRAIYAARGKTSNAEKEVRIVNVRRGKRAGRRGMDAFYGRMVEYGHRLALSRKRLIRDTTATTKKGFDRYQDRLVAEGKRRIRGERTWGTVPPKPFMRPAWDAGQRVALDRVYDKLREVINNAIGSSRF
jgi:hypothetical protein